MNLGDILRSFQISLKFSFTFPPGSDDQDRSSAEDSSFDARGIPTAVCPACGDGWFMVPVSFDEETYEVDAWALEGTCIGCGTEVTVCCPVDIEERLEGLSDGC